MGVISIRLNDKEEHILRELTRYYNEDKSSLIKRTLIDLYEDKLDFEEIEKFEKKEKKGKVRFKTFKEVNSK